MTDDNEIIKSEVARAGRIFGMFDASDAFSVGGDLLAAGVTVVNGKAIGVADAMTRLKRRSPALFKDARNLSPADRASELRRISRESERSGWDAHDRAHIERLKAEQASYLQKRDSQ